MMQAMFDFYNYRDAQSGYHLRPDTSDYGKLLPEQCWTKCPLVYIFLAPPVYLD